MRANGMWRRVLTFSQSVSQCANSAIRFDDQPAESGWPTNDDAADRKFLSRPRSECAVEGSEEVNVLDRCIAEEVLEQFHLEQLSGAVPLIGFVVADFE